MLLSQDPSEDVFDPVVHLQYTPPTTIYTFDDLKLERPAHATQIGASSPFPLLSEEGIRAYRRAISAPDVLKNCASNPFKKTLMLRNAAKYSSFIRDLWTHPRTKSIIAEVAGVPLSPVFTTEIGHTNLQTKSTKIEDMVLELSVEPSTLTYELSDEQKNFDPLSSPSIAPWQYVSLSPTLPNGTLTVENSYDSYPYVCVLMLSNTEGMRGGETWLKKGDGTALKVEGPSIGHCVFLQGGQVQHLAASAVGVHERITTITSLRADALGTYDSSYLTNIRPISNLPILYKEWVEYRLSKMKTEITALEANLDNGSAPDISTINQFANAQIDYLRRTSDQLVAYQLHDRILGRFGKDAYYSASDCWSRIQAHPDFEKLSHDAESVRYQPGSKLWSDYMISRAILERSGKLSGQLGPLVWTGQRQYTFGDELLRQGLREYFFEWLEETGMDRLL